MDDLPYYAVHLLVKSGLLNFRLGLSDLIQNLPNLQLYGCNFIQTTNLPFVLPTSGCCVIQAGSILCWKNLTSVDVYSLSDDGSSGDLLVTADRLMRRIRQFLLPDSSPSDPATQGQFIWLPAACCHRLFSAAGGKVVLPAGIFTNFS